MRVKGLDAIVKINHPADQLTWQPNQLNIKAVTKHPDQLIRLDENKTSQAQGVESRIDIQPKTELYDIDSFMENTMLRQDDDAGNNACRVTGRSEMCVRELVIEMLAELKSFFLSI